MSIHVDDGAGAHLTREQINVLFGIATNGFFVFAPFPASDSFASFLLGQSVQFFQGGGQFDPRPAEVDRGGVRAGRIESLP